MSSPKITEGLLKDKLVEKHKRFLADYQGKRKDLERLIMLEDKIDQLSHWIESEESKDTEKLSEDKKKAEEELNGLRSHLGALSHKKINELDDKIREHEDALAYWSKR
jgi:hypothetical protein